MAKRRKRTTPFATRLRELRKKRRLTQTEFGKLVGIAQSGVCNYERGERRPSLETAIRFAKALGVSIKSIAQ